MKRALVTGGSGDIGGAICQRLGSDGLHVIVHAHTNAERAERIAAEIRTAGGSAETVVFDVTDGDQTRHAIEHLLDAGPIQVLVNNAGIYSDAPLAGMKPEQWASVVDVCLNSFYTVTNPIVLPMLATRWGRIINISSVSAVKGNSGQVNYAAAKAGLHGASRALALELASRNVSVNVVAPGLIQGRITDHEFDRQMIKRLVPMRRAGTADEVAALVAFLASDEAGYISGQVIGIDGLMA